MKQFLTLSLLLALVIPIAVFATGGIGVGGGIGGTQPDTSTPIATPTPTPTPTQSSTNTSDTGSFSDFAEANAASGGSEESISAASIAQQIECGMPTTGGVLQNAVRSLRDSAISGIRSGLRGQGDFGRAISDILRGDGVGDVINGLGEGLGDYAGSYVEGLLNREEVCGDSSLGQSICGEVGEYLGDYVGEVVGGVVTDVVGSVVGDAFGGVVGGVVGGLLGGGGDGVPVIAEGTDARIEASNKQLATTHQVISVIEAETEIELRNNCELKPTVAALGLQTRAEAGAKVLETIATGADGEPLVIENVQKELARARLAEQERFVDEGVRGTNKEFVRDQLRRVVTNEVSGEPQADCAPKTGLAKLLQQWRQPDCTTAGAVAINTSKLYERGRAGETALKNAVDLGTTKPRGFCPEDGPNAGSTDISNCPDTFVTTTNAKSVQSSFERATEQIFDIDAEAIGEAADDLLANVLEEIFTVAGDELESGVRRLVSNRTSGSRSSSSREGGNYLDRMTGGTLSVQQGQRLFQSNVTNSVAIEAEYQAATRQILDSLYPLRDTFVQIQACYAGHAQNPPAGLTREQALSAASNASTTITRVLDTQIASRERDFTASQNAVRQLGVVLDETRSAATSPEQTNAVASTFNALGQAGITHTLGELEFLLEDMARLIPAFALAQQDANAQLATCRAYTP